MTLLTRFNFRFRIIFHLRMKFGFISLLTFDFSIRTEQCECVSCSEMSASNLVDLPPSPSRSASNTNHLSQSATNYHHSRSVPIFDECSDPSAVWVEGAGAEAARVGRHNRCVHHAFLFYWDFQLVWSDQSSVRLN